MIVSVTAIVSRRVVAPEDVEQHANATANSKGALKDAIDVMNVNNDAAINEGVSCGNRRARARSLRHLNSGPPATRIMRRKPAPPTRKNGYIV